MKSPLRLLHLEDNRRDAFLIRETVRAELPDLDLVVVETRVEYEGRLEEGGFDLILCDFSLPSFDGFSAFALAQERCPAIPFIFLSGAIGEEVAVKALKMGVTDIVSKDHLARLLPALHRALDEAEDRLCRGQAEEQFRQ